MVNVTGIWWVDVAIVAAAFLAAIAGIWHKGIKPASHWVAESWRNIKHVLEIGSTLVEIADEFRPNGGGSLRDVVDRVETQGQEAKVALTDQLVHSAARDAEVSSLRAEQIAHAAVDAESFAEVKGAVSTAQAALDRLTEIVTSKAIERAS